MLGFAFRPSLEFRARALPASPRPATGGAVASAWPPRTWLSSCAYSPPVLPAPDPPRAWDGHSGCRWPVPVACAGAGAGVEAAAHAVLLRTCRGKNPPPVLDRLARFPRSWAGAPCRPRRRRRGAAPDGWWAAGSVRPRSPPACVRALGRGGQALRWRSNRPFPSCCAGCPPHGHACHASELRPGGPGCPRRVTFPAHCGTVS